MDLRIAAAWPRGEGPIRNVRLVKRVDATIARERSGSRRALFVDRDGTLNPDLHYLREAERLEVFRGVGEALSLARDHGYAIVCVTNQSGIERGFYTREDVEQIHTRLNELLRPNRAHVDAFYYCPHAPESQCACRKPWTALFERAAHDMGLDFATSAIVGDRSLDIEAGDRLGLLTALVVPPGHEAAMKIELAESGVRPAIAASRFRSAVHRVLARG
jgi:D-glycero-D-manno-heptose 1,7-bisphosphate phosphatase